jgi:hypothetical protein
MPVSSSAARVEGFIGDDFRRKFVDEENYIDVENWADPPSSINNVVSNAQGETYRKGVEPKPLDPRSTKQSERSEDVHGRVSGLHPIRDAAHHAPTRGVNLNAMRAGKAQVKNVQAANRKLKQTVKLRLVRQPIDWTKLDQVGRPVVSFNPFDKDRQRLLKILKRDWRDVTRMELVRKLGVEFSRIYERYRRDAERRRTGGLGFLYEVQGDTERRHCEEAAVQCILRAVTPRQVMEYWDKHAKDFVGSAFVIPPLAFLKSPSSIDRVAVSASGTVSKLEGTRKAKTPESKLRPTDRNTFSGTDGLDVRLRSTLEAAGFKTQAYNDRYLLSIQHNALAIAAGKNIILAEGRMRAMVLCAVELYADADS